MADRNKFKNDPLSKEFRSAATQYCNGEDPGDVRYRKGFMDGCYHGYTQCGFNVVGHILRLHYKWKAMIDVTPGWFGCPAFKEEVWIKNHWDDVE